MWEEILYRISQIILAVIRIILHSILAFVYGGKGKIIPIIRNPILLKSASKLAQEIREGNIKSEDVIQAYINRILEVEPYINATAYRFFEEAMEQARETDALIASGKYTQEQLASKKPLLGVPFTVKVIFHVKDMPCTGASPLFEDQVATKDAATVALMRGAGAILIATTNAAEMAIGLESVNKSFGRTCNPYDTNRTPGGSSGGESALIAAGGSLIGLGNDFMGSIRIPTHLTGIFGHKPTSGFIPSTGSFPPEYPNRPLQSLQLNLYKYISAGPLCRYSEDLATVMKILSSEAELKVDFNQKFDFKKLKICYLTNIRSPFVAPLDKTTAAALKSAVTFFERKCNIVANEIKMPSLFDINTCYGSVFVDLMNEFKTEACKMNGLNENLEIVKSLFGKSKLTFPTAVAVLLTSLPLLNRKDKADYYAKKIKGLAEHFRDILDVNTVLLMATAPYIAPYHNGTLPFMLSVGYTGLFNLLGQPSTHCPMGFNEQKLPYGVQIVGCHGNDALTIACAAELEKEFGGWKQPGEV